MIYGHQETDSPRFLAILPPPRCVLAPAVLYLAPNEPASLVMEANSKRTVLAAHEEAGVLEENVLFIGAQRSWGALLIVDGEAARLPSEKLS